MSELPLLTRKLEVFINFHRNGIARLIEGGGAGERWRMELTDIETAYLMTEIDTALQNVLAARAQSEQRLASEDAP